MSTSTRSGALRRASHACLGLLALAAATLAGGCATGHPQPISARSLAEAQTFPFYRLYWVGMRFDGQPLAAADGQRGYLNAIGDSVYYGDCVHSKGVFGGGSCRLPLQVTTVIYRLHSNAPLGPQRNILVRNVPATVYDGGRSIEIYSGRVAIDVFSKDFAHALEAAMQLRPINASGYASEDLPPPVYCPGLVGPLDAKLEQVLSRLPHDACQRAGEALALDKRLSGRS